MLTEEFLAQNKAILEKERERLKKLLTALGKEDCTPSGGEKTEKAVATVRMMQNGKSQHVIAASLSETELALARIGKGVYTLCRVCGKKIGEERLRALPQASTCVTCSETINRRTKNRQKPKTRISCFRPIRPKQRWR